MAAFFGASLNETDFRRIQKAVDRLIVSARRAQTECPRTLAEGYVEEVREAIISSKYSSKYQDYNERYEEWKHKHGKGLRFWDLFGDLISNLHAFPVESGFFGGIPSGTMDSGGKSWLGKGDKGPSKDIAWYGWIMEEGGVFVGNAGVTQRHPKRALFTPVFNSYKIRARKALTPYVLEFRECWK